MKLKKGIITHTNEDGFLLIGSGDDSFNGIIKLNKTGEYLIKCLKTDTTFEEIIDKFKNEFNGTEEEISKDVTNALNQLKEVNAIDY